MSAFSEIINAFRYLPVMLPRWVWLLLGVTLFSAAIYALMVRLAQRRRRMAKPVPPPVVAEPGESAAKEGKPEEAAERRPPAFRSWLTRKVCRYRFATIFRAFLKTLRLHVSGRDYRYQIPWVLLIGEEGAGKSTLLHHLQMDRPFGAPEVSEVGCDAWLFDQGVVLDLAGRYVLNHEAGSDAPCWLQFLRTLHGIRPRKPLEAIVLTLSAREILASLEQPDLAQEKALHLYRKLWGLQKELGMRLPVYLLITQCDQLEGFTAFSEALPERLLENMLGWSNADTLQTTYSDHYADLAFSQIYRDLNEMQLELIASSRRIENPDTLLLFPHSLRPLFKGLKPWLNRIFHPSVYQESFFLRGIYCCGALPVAKEQHGKGRSASDQIEFLPGVGGRIEESRVVYLTHLFRDKIFRESGIAHPVAKSVLWQMRRLWALQAAFAVLLLLIIGGQWVAYQRLDHEKQEIILPVFAGIREDIERLESARRELEASPANVAILEQVKTQSATRLISSLGTIRTESFSSLFLPLSWSSPINDDLTRALAAAYDTFILQWLYDGLDRRIHDILFKGVSALDSYRYRSLIEVPEYALLQRSLNELGEFVHFVTQYNELERQSAEYTVRTIQELAHYTHGLRVATTAQPRNFTLSGKAFGKIENFKAFRLAAYQEEAQGQISYLTEQWLEKFFSYNTLMLTMQGVVDDLEQIRRAGRDPDALLRLLEGLQQKLSEVERHRSSPEWQWLNQESISNVIVFQQFTAKVAATPLLGESFSTSLTIKAERRYQAFRNEMARLQERLGAVGALSDASAGGGAAVAAVGGGGGGAGESATGVSQSGAGMAAESRRSAAATTPLPIASADTGLSSPREPRRSPEEGEGSEGASATQQLDVRQQLEAFMREEFMRELPFGAMRITIPEDRLLFWDPAMLEQTVELVDNYVEFREYKEPNLAPELRETVRQSGQARLNRNLQSLLSRAQQIKARPYALYPQYQEDALREHVENYAQSAPLVSALIERLGRVHGYAGLISILRRQQAEIGVGLLERADRLLESDHLYDPRAAAFSNWDGVSPLSKAAFGVADQEELEYYLALQRRRMGYLVENYVQPTLKVLGELQQGAAVPSSHLQPRWERITQELDRYNRSDVASSLAQLERFVLFDLDKVTLESCFDELKGARTHARADYFARKQQTLRESLFQQCVTLAEAQGEARYGVLQRSFSDHLAGRFPFSKNSYEASAAGLGSLHPNQLRNFFARFTRHATHLEGTLEITQAFDDSRQQAIHFIEQMRQLERLFESFLKAEAPDALPEYEFTVEFRVNRDFEVGANQIIDWQLEVNSVPIREVDGVWRGVWRYGDPVTLNLRWARNSRFRPRWDGVTQRQRLNIVGEESAVLHYAGEWALFELLAENQPRVIDFPVGSNRDNSLLKIKVPVARLIEALELEGQTESDPSLSASGQLPSRGTRDRHLLLYQERYRELFEEAEEAVLYMRIRLYPVGTTHQVLFTEFPERAPLLERAEQHNPILRSGAMDSRRMVPQEYTLPSSLIEGESDIQPPGEAP